MIFSRTSIAKDFRAAVALAILTFSATAVLAETGPFAGFDGAWSGNGMVSLANGTSEQIRCRATYNVEGNSHLKQTLRCASASYRFELSSDVTSQGNHVTGSWKEASRRIFGNLQGSVGAGQIDVFVEASGFAANLTLATRGNKQIVSITSKGEIRDVTINLVRG